MNQSVRLLRILGHQLHLFEQAIGAVPFVLMLWICSMICIQATGYHL